MSWTNCLGALRPDVQISDVELGWVDEAVQAAQVAGHISGWAAVPWPQLVEDLIALDGIALDDSSTDRTIPEGWTCLLGRVAPSFASACVAVLDSDNIAVTRRTVATLSGLRQPLEQLLVRTDDAQRAHDLILQWMRNAPRSQPA
ncbi:MAG: hypothetical protein ACRDY1_10430 [Acidimicrobiales bacterium]